MSVLVTKESGLGQKLVFRSLERALNDLDVEGLAESKIAVNVHTQTNHGVRLFAREYVVDRLKERGLKIVSDESQADRVLDVFISVLGIDGGETLVGLPSIPISPYGLTTPELALYKSSRYQGETEVQVYTFDGGTGDFIGKTRTSTGGSYYRRERILLFINYTKTDLDQ